MSLIIWFAIISVVIELSLFFIHKLWVVRQWVAVGLVILISLSASGLIFLKPNLFTGLLLVASIFRLFNVLRVVENRINEKHLYQSAKKTSFGLIGWEIIILLAWFIVYKLSMRNADLHNLIIGLLWSLVLVAFILSLSTLRNLKKTKPKLPLKNINDHELPTVSVCIPARNETDDLTEILQTLIASNYPKLEILVLDDCSANKRTPEIIRGFAHDGVRFIQGTNPPKHWLAKNWAYNQLLKEASGKYVLFCGVDIRFDADSIRLMVETLIGRRKKMISLVPEMPRQTHLSLIQPMRYWWELVPLRRLFNRPPVLSSCWIADRESVDNLGGLEAVSRSIIPEAFFAKSLIKEDGYSFIRASNILGISSYKNSTEQRLTAIRTRYPQLHRRPELVLSFSLVEFTFLLLPFVLLIGGWFINLDLAEMLPIIVACIMLVFCYESVIISTIPEIFALSMFMFPFAVIGDITLMNYSMIKYELSTVNWKGRNICLPVMHSTPS